MRQQRENLVCFINLMMAYESLCGRGERERERGVRWCLLNTVGETSQPKRHECLKVWPREREWCGFSQQSNISKASYHSVWSCIKITFE